jgi:hypothetical protein
VRPSGAQTGGLHGRDPAGSGLAQHLCPTLTIGDLHPSPAVAARPALALPERSAMDKGYCPDPGRSPPSRPVRTGAQPTSYRPTAGRAQLIFVGSVGYLLGHVMLRWVPNCGATQRKAAHLITLLPAELMLRLGEDSSSASLCLSPPPGRPGHPHSGCPGHHPSIRRQRVRRASRPNWRREAPADHPGAANRLRGHVRRAARRGRGRCRWETQETDMLDVYRPATN